MPTATFFNLPEEKRNRIFNAAVEEFAGFRFSDASINRIVKAAGIPRGSFYQYFDGKEDLYLHILEKIGEEKMKIFSQHRLADPSLSFFQAVNAAMPAIWDWADQHPLYSRIGLQMVRDDDEFVRRTVRRMDSSRELLVRLLEEDQRRGFIRREVDPALTADLYLSIVTAFLQSFFSAGSRDEAVSRVQAIFDILFHGILRQDKEAQG